MKSDSPRSPVVYYDASCGICTASTRRWGPMLLRRGIEMLPLQDPESIARLNLRPGELPDEIKLSTSRGDILGGADALLYLVRRIWWAWPIFAISFLPGARRLMRYAYSRFALNRYRISAACSLPRS